MRHTINNAPVLESSKTLTFKVDAVSKCPLCHASYYPHPIYTFGVTDSTEKYYDSYNIFALYFCPNCQDAFLSKYFIYDYKSGYGNTASHRWSAPESLATPDVNKYVKALSPNFCKMYHQAHHAEIANLPELAGMGYRCALEFLIKDYLLHTTPGMSQDEQMQTKNLPLSRAINTLNNEHIKALALGIAWLGNDSAHYISKHPDRDLQDLKNFFNAVLQYIVTELTVEDALNLINKK